LIKNNIILLKISSIFERPTKRPMGLYKNLLMHKYYYKSIL